MFLLLVSLIFFRPFISFLAYPYLELFYSFLMTGLLVVMLFLKRPLMTKIDSAHAPLYLFSIALAFSVLAARDRLNSMEQIFKYLPALLLCFFCSLMSKRDSETVLKTMVTACLAVSLYAIYHYFFGSLFLVRYLQQQAASNAFALDYLQRRRAFSPFVTPNTLAGYLVMMLPLVVTDRRRNLFIVPVLVALLLTKSLGACISLVSVFAVYLFFKKGLRQKGLVALAALLLVTLAVFASRVTTQKPYLKPLFSTTMRIAYWKHTLAMIKSSPLIGVGPGNFNSLHSRFAHNSHLQIWAEMGIAGMAAWLWIIVSWLRTGIRKWKTDAGTGALLLACVAFLIHNLIDFSFFLPEVSMLWWALMGLLISRPDGQTLPQPPAA